MICKYCGKEFEQKTGNQKFCCEQCCNKFFSQRLDRQRKEGTSFRKKIAKKVEFNKEDYKQNFKNHCVSCGKPIKVDWKHYQAYGNYCEECNGRAFKKHKEEYKKNKRGTC